MSRILNLPKRDWTQYDEELIVREMTDLCRTANGTMSLRPIQAVALYEAYEHNGLMLAARTGAGKTLVSGLLPFVLGAKRPLLLVPAKLRTKTRLEFQKLRLHWRIAKELRVESYEKIGLEQHANFLTEYAPDLIICDESHMLKHVTDSARARRLARHMHYHPETRLCAMTATMGQIDDYAHTLTWALRAGAPVPREPEHVATWASILNAKVADHLRGDPEELVPHLGEEALDKPRSAFRDRLTSTPGMLVSVDKFDSCGLIVRPRYVEPAPEIETAFAELRLAWSMPDGWDMADATFECWHAARQLALGYYYVHDPRPPEVFRDVRRKYCKFVRLVLEFSEAYDTEKQVREALEGGRLIPPAYIPAERIELDVVRAAGVLGLDVFAAWKHIQPTYTPERYPVWLSDTVIDDAIQWGRTGVESTGGIIWVDSVAFGTRLSEKTGWAYFRNLGRDQNGRFIESDRVRSSETIIASIESNKEGRNLQGKWYRNLIVDPPNSGNDWEQLVSRTHRDGQLRKDVLVDYLVTCYEYYNSPYSALHSNDVDNQTSSQSFRLLDADVIMPTLKDRKGEYTWQPMKKKNKVTV